MKISLNWLKRYLDINEDIKYIEHSLTDIGLEVSHIEFFSMLNENLIIGKIVSCIQHPDAERLKITQVNVGDKDALLNIVCGAPNVRIGQKVIIAPVGIVLDLADGTQLKIKKAKIRGQVSEGMICAEDEIGLSTNHDTIMELDTDLDPGVPAVQYFGIQKDTIIEIDITPNRTDALCHIGVARDLAARLKKNIKYPSIDEELFFKKDNDSKLKVKVEDPTLCVRYSGLVIKDVVIKESPIWLKEKLKSIGLTPINNIVDITNFVLQEYGQPLHAFDYDTIEDQTIVVKTIEPTDFSCLDNKTRKLHGDEIMICDTKKPLCIAGIIGGENSCVTSETKNIFLESACFNPVSISKVAKKLGISTDASFRYERGTDPNITIMALKRAAEMIVKEANGAIASDIVDIYPKKVEKSRVKLDCKYLNKLVGQEILKSEIIDILKRLEIRYKDNGDILDLEIPTYRIDVTRPADVAEEILRIYGYNNIKTVDNNVQYEYIAPDSKATSNSKRKNKIADLLVAKDYNEIITNSLTNSEYSKIAHSKWDFPISINQNKYSIEKETIMDGFMTQTSTTKKDEKIDFEASSPTFSEENIEDKFPNVEKESIDILNPLSSITNSLRTTLLFSGLEVIARNINRGNKHLNLFEFGKIYYKSSKKETSIDASEGFDIFEEQRLGIWLTGTKDQRFWIKQSQDSEFQKLNSVIHGIFEKLKIPINTFLKDSILYFCTGKDHKNSICKLGMLGDNILEKFKIQQNVVYGEVNWELIKNIVRKETVYTSISVFPAVSRDLSLILDNNIMYEEVVNVTESLNDPKIQQISLVDTYEREKLRGKKTYTINFKLRDFKKTLKEKNINKTMANLISVYEKQLGAEIRDH